MLSLRSPANAGYLVEDCAEAEEEKVVDDEEDPGPNGGCTEEELNSQRLLDTIRDTAVSLQRCGRPRPRKLRAAPGQLKATQGP